CVTSKIDDCVPSAATSKTGRGNSTAAHRSWSSCSPWKITWFSIRNRCCTRSWTQNPQAASCGSSTGGTVVVVVGGAGLVVVGCNVVVVVVVVVDEVVVVVVVTAGSVVVVLVTTTTQRLRSCGETTRMGTGALSIPSNVTVSASSRVPFMITLLGPFWAAFPVSKANTRPGST